VDTQKVGFFFFFFFGIEWGADSLLEELPRTIRRGCILVAKLIQSIANFKENSTFKEPYMNPFTQLLQQYKPSLSAFLLSLVS
jgi:6-phosphogluconate dehydrogenase